MASSGGGGNGVVVVDRLEGARWNWEVMGICAGLAVMVFAVFGRTLWDGFVNYDDNFNVYRTPEVIAGITAHGIVWAFKTSQVGDWIPLTTLSHMLDCQVYGLHAWGHHLTNVLLHALAAMLMFLALRELTGRILRSGFVAAVFAIHPLRVESVAWVTERKDVLSGVFFMLTLLAYVSYTRRPESKLRYWRMAGLLVLGLLSKAMLVTAPFVLLLLDWWPLKRMEGGQGWRGVARLAVEKIPLILISAVFAVVQMVADREAVITVGNIPVSERVANAVVSYAAYLWQTVWPVDMAVLYPHPGGNIGVWELTLALGTLGAVSAGAIVWRKSEPWLLMGWLWYLGMLVPVIGVVQTGVLARADRYTYLPMIGVYVAGTWAVADRAERRRNYRMILAGVAAAALCVLMVLAWNQASYWHDSETLWSHTLAVTRGNYIAHNERGTERLDQGRTEEAVEDFRESLRINPIQAVLHYDMGSVLAQTGHNNEAIEEYREALRLEPGMASANVNLGNALMQAGKIDEAIAEYREALISEPTLANAHASLGMALAETRHVHEAIAEYREALRLDPTLAAANVTLGNVLLQTGKTDEAIEEFKEALSKNPALETAHFNLANALAQRGMPMEAIAEYVTAVRLRPGNTDARYNLANTLLATGQTGAAISEYEDLLKLKPDFAPGHGNLGAALMQEKRIDEAIAQLREAVELDPAYADARCNLGDALLLVGKAADGGIELEKALQARPGSPAIENTLAWFLATAPEVSLRDGARAVKLAGQATEATGGNNPAILRTLAAAYAEAGQFTDATSTAQKALELAEVQNNDGVAEALRRELPLYHAGHRYGAER